MAESFNIYQKWLGIPLHQQPPHHYRLLGIELFESDPDIISHAADRQMAHVRTLSTGEHVALAQQLLNEVSAARVQLLNPAKKAAYDAALNADLAGQRANAPSADQSPREPAPAVGVQAEAEAPVWRHPAVLITGAVCAVLVVGICTALVLQSRPTPVAENQLPGDEYGETGAYGSLDDEPSPGRMAEVPVDPAEEETASETPASEKNTSPQTAPNTSESNSDKTAAAEPPSTTDRAKNTDGTDSPASRSAEPMATEPMTTEPMMADPMATEAIASARTSDPEASNTRSDPSTPSTENSAAENSREDSTSGNRRDTEAEMVDAAFTAEDPGPPEPDEDATPVVKKREILPVPDAEAIAKTLAEVKEIFAVEYAAAKTYEQRRALAQFLWRQAQNVQEDPVSHYVLMSESRAQAEAGGDFKFTMQLADRMEKFFLVDGLEMKIESLGTFSRSAKNDGGRHIVATAAVQLADEASRAHQFAIAEKLTTQAQSLAQRVGDNNLRQKARLLANEIKKRRQAWATIQNAIDTLEKNPSNGEANLIYGKYLCLSEHDWEAGLPRLAQSSQAELSKLARRDLADPQETAEQIALGDAWFDFAQSDPAWEPFRLREHHWYLTALPEATGLMRTKLEKRLRENPLVRFKVSWLSLPSKAEAESAKSPFE